MPQRVQPKGFSPVCDILCVLRIFEREKALPHWEHENGLSPVWDLIWILSVLEVEKALPQYEQDNSISSVWDIWCLNSCPDMESSILGRGWGDTAFQDQQCIAW